MLSLNISLIIIIISISFLKKPDPFFNICLIICKHNSVVFILTDLDIEVLEKNNSIFIILFLEYNLEI